jgi:hypothetical protein
VRVLHLLFDREYTLVPRNADVEVPDRYGDVMEGRKRYLKSFAGLAP